MNDFLELAKTRYSVRKYADKPVEKEKLDKIIEAGHVAPTGANLQPQRIYVLQSDEALERIRGIANTFNAPSVLIVAYDEMADIIPQEKRVVVGVQAVGSVTTHMILEATDLGVGSCWINSFDAEEVAREFGLPESEKVVMLVALGYRAEDSAPLDKWHSAYKPLEDVVAYL